MTPSEINNLIKQPFFNYAVGFLVASLGAMFIDWIMRGDDK